jgi:glycosyltransferase involved in cell wall biosynthesis
MAGPAKGAGGLASIILPCSNGLTRTRACLAALMRHTRLPWELILIDDATGDGTAIYLAGIRDTAPIRVEILTHTVRRGFPACCHEGLKLARGDYLVLLGQHAVVTDAWLDQLTALAEADPKIGLAGPMSNAAAPPQRVGRVPYADLEGMHRFAERWRAEHRGQWLTAASLSSACVLIKRRVLDVLGGQRGIRAGGLRRRRLSVRAQRAGFRLAVAHDLFVHYFDESTAPVRDLGVAAAPAAEPLPPLGAGAAGQAAAGSPVAPAPRLAAQGPAPHESRRRRVSLTMIVRNEERNLPACLGSAADLFDEVVVVDTGSTDRTAEVARSYGARVFDFVWVDDFAAARNAALARATGDYAFWLDADDVLDPPQRDKLRALLAGLREGDEAAYVVRCACDPDQDGGGGQTVVDHVRLFPLREEVRWAYAVHEQILPSLRRAGIDVRWTDLIVRHTGYCDPQVRARKLERDTRILETELAERPDDPFVLFNLGSIAIERQDWRAALAYLRMSLSGSAPSDSITRKLYALIARAHQMLGESEAALSACAAGLAADPDDAELLFRTAVLHRHTGDARRAEACWRKVLTLRRPERFSSVDVGIYGHLSRRNLAAIVEERGDHAEAARLWSAVLEECPGDVEALRARDRLAGRRKPAGMAP